MGPLPSPLRERGPHLPPLFILINKAIQTARNGLNSVGGFGFSFWKGVADFPLITDLRQLVIFFINKVSFVIWTFSPVFSHVEWKGRVPFHFLLSRDCTKNYLGA